MVGRNPGLLAMRPAQVRYHILCIYYDLSQTSHNKLLPCMINKNN